MNEIERRELKGLGGWLVLFQIQIFYTLSQAVQMAIMFLVSGIMLRIEFFAGAGSEAELNPLDMWRIFNSPFAYILAAAVFVFTLLCIIYFYKRRKVFRIFFIIESVIEIGALCLLIFSMLRWMTGFFAQMAGEGVPFGKGFAVFYLLFAILPAAGIVTAFIIALFKSKRVKNTFC